MKKLIAWILLVILAVGVFAGCGCQAQPEETAPSESVAQGPSQEIQDVIEYLKAIYKDDGAKTPVDFERFGIVRIAGIPYEVVWTADVGEDLIKIVVNDDGTVTIDVNEEAAEDTPYVLTATVTDENGNSVSHSWNYILPQAVDMVAIVDAAYALAPGESLPYESTLRGKIISVDTPWDDNYKNITVTIEITGAEDRPIKCYRLKGEGADELQIGDTITVTGTIKNYNGNIEFDAGCTLDAVVPGERVKAPDDPKQIVDEAYALGANKSLPYEATLTGKITQIKTPYDPNYGNVTVEFVVEGREYRPIVCYRLKGSGADRIGVNDIITVKGYITNYVGDKGYSTIEFVAGCQLVKWEDRPSPVQPSDPKQVIDEAYALGANKSLPYEATLTGKITKVGTAYDPGYGNITVTMVIEGRENKPLVCYRMKGSGVDKIDVGDTITVKGYIKNYVGDKGYSTIEFDYPTLLSYKKNSAVAPEDPVEIVKAAYALPAGQQLPYKATLTGKITEVNTKYDSGYDNITVTIVVEGAEDMPIKCYRMKGNGISKIDVGDTITVVGNIENYQHSSGDTEVEYTAGCQMISWVDSSEEEPEKPVVVPGLVDAPVVGEAYKFGMVQGNLENKVFFITGAMDGYYMATTEDAAAAADVYLEETNGGYYLYTQVGGAKKYINMVVSGTHVNGAFENAAATVYTYDEDSKTVIATVEGAPYWFGTRNDKTFTTVGPCKTEYEGFYCQFYASEGGETPEEPEKPAQVDIATALAATSGDFTVKGVVTVVDGSNYYVQDATGAICVRLATNTTEIKLGDTIIGTGTRADYNGMPQLGSATFEKSSGLKLKAKETTIDALTTADICTYVTIKGLTITEVFDNNGQYSTPNVTVQDANGNSIQIYKAAIAKNGDQWAFAVGDEIDFTGAVGVFKETLQLRNTLTTEIVDAGSAPVVPEEPEDPEQPEIVDIATALAATTGDFTVKGVVTVVDGSNYYVQDATGAICVRLAEKTDEIKLGDTIIGTGARADYNGMPQLGSATFEKSSGLTLKAKETTIDALTTADICTYVTIKGLTITEVFDNNGQYSTPNLKVQDANGKAIEIYKAAVEKTDGKWAFAVGDVIDFTGAVGVFKDTLQLRNTLTSEIVLAGTAPEQPDEPEKPEDPETSLEVVDDPVVEEAYKFGMVQANVENKVFYITGAMEGYYMATTEDAAAAADVYLEQATDGYYLYTKVDGAKKYINMVVSGTHVNGAFEDTAATLYTYDEESKTVIATVEGAPYWFGTRNDKSFTTVGPCKTEYEGFYCQFYTEQSEEPETPAAPSVVEKPVTEEAYKFGMVQANVENKLFYITGAMEGYYMATTEDAAAAADVYLEATPNGYYLYTEVDGAKKYINMVVSGTHVNGAFEDAAATVYTYDEDSKTVIATVEGAPYWFGTRNDKSFTTVGPCKTEYEGFYCQFYATQGGSQTPSEPEQPELPEGAVTVETALAAEEGEFTVMGVVTVVDSSNYYVQDATGGICVRLAEKTDEIKLGDTIIGTGTRADYNGLPQLDKATFEKSEEAIELKAKETTIDALTEKDICTYVTIKGLTVTEVFDNNGQYSTPNLTVKDEKGNSIQIYKAAVVKENGAWTVKVGDIIDYTGSVGIHKETLQLRNTETTEIVITGAAEVPEETPDVPQEPTGESVKISFADVANRTDLSTTKQVWQQNGITVTNEKTGDSSEIVDYSNPARFYKYSKLTIACSGMKTLVVNCRYEDNAQALLTVANAMSGVTATINGTVVTIQLSAAADSFVIDSLSAGKVFVYDITIYKA